MPGQKRTLKAYDCPPTIKKKWNKKEGAIQNGAYYEHPQTRDYLMQQHRNSKISMTTKVAASKHSCKDLHQQNSLIIPSGKRQEN
jgi:hypothetical protein